MFARLVVSLVLGLGIASSAAAELRLPALFSDSLVLQRELPIRIWGWADAGSEVECELAELRAKVTANADGRWEAVLNPVAVRYSWASNPIGNLSNNSGLPASPFRTDDWDR